MRTAIFVIAITGIVLAAIGLTTRYLPITNHVTLALAAVSPYLMAVGPVAALLLVVTRRWLTAALTAALTIAAIATQLPLFVTNSPPTRGANEIRVLTANVLEGQANPQELAQRAAERADILVVQELTGDLAANLTTSGIDTEFPYRATDPGDHGGGAGIWSRYPITSSTRIEGYRLTMLTADIKTQGAGHDTTVVAVHLPGPWPQPIDSWRDEIHQLPKTLAEIADGANGAVIAAGDFNATWDMDPFRRALTNGYRDAAEQSGAGLIRTFPADKPLIGIDHILLYRSTATHVETVHIPGSDHLGLLATIGIPQTP